MADSQRSLENQLKRQILVCAKASLLIKWKVDLGDFPADPDTEVHCINIKTFELNFQLSFELNFERFDANLIFFFHFQFHCHFQFHFLSISLFISLSYANSRTELDMKTSKHQE